MVKYNSTYKDIMSLSRFNIHKKSLAVMLLVVLCGCGVGGGSHPAPLPERPVVVSVSNEVAALGVLLLDKEDKPLANEPLPSVGVKKVSVPKGVTRALFYTPYGGEVSQGVLGVSSDIEVGYAKIPIVDSAVSAPSVLTPLRATVELSFSKEVERSAVTLHGIEGLYVRGTFDWRSERLTLTEKGVVVPNGDIATLLPQEIGGGVVLLTYRGVEQKLPLPKAKLHSGEKLVVVLSPEGGLKLRLHSFTVKDYEVKATSWGFVMET